MGDLFSDKTVSSFLASMARKARENVKGVANVYTQHTPLLCTTLKNVARGQLAHMDYPYVSGAETSPTAAKVVASDHDLHRLLHYNEFPDFCQRCMLAGANGRKACFMSGCLLTADP